MKSFIHHMYDVVIILSKYCTELLEGKIISNVCLVLISFYLILNVNAIPNSQTIGFSHLGQTNIFYFKISRVVFI